MWWRVLFSQQRVSSDRAWSEYQPDENPLAGLRVLLADDNIVNRMLASRMLAKLGCAAQATSNGREAVEEWKRGTYEMVLMDVQMPEMDGFEATRLIRELEMQSGAARTPVVAMTAHALPEDRGRCLDAGMDLYLSKPVSLSGLAATLKVAQTMCAAKVAV